MPEALKPPRPPYTQADLVREFVTEPRWTQCRVAGKMQELAQTLQQAGQKDTLVPVTYSCLSRWKTSDKPVSRPKFIAVALASSHLEWESSGKLGPPPELSDILALWEERHTLSPLRLKKENQADESQWRRSQHPLTAETADPSDTDQIKSLRAYGPTGVNLLTAARAGDRLAALDFGLLRALDGHRREANNWFHIACDDNTAEPCSSASEVTVEYGAPLSAMAQAALKRALELQADDRNHERRVLLLEKAANHEMPQAAGLLAAHFEDLGEIGAAARWRAAAT